MGGCNSTGWTVLLISGISVQSTSPCTLAVMCGEEMKFFLEFICIIYVENFLILCSLLKNMNTGQKDYLVCLFQQKFIQMTINIIRRPWIKKEQKYALWRKMDETVDHLKWNKPHPQRQIFHVFSYMWNLGGGEDMKVERRLLGMWKAKRRRE
jgi:hypothetical protein